MDFDIVPYLERIAKAMPDRFEWTMDIWDCFDTVGNRRIYKTSSDKHLTGRTWEFFGPLADEAKVIPIRVFDVEMVDEKKCRVHVGWSHGTLLESIVAGVTEWAEAQGKVKR